MFINKCRFLGSLVAAMLLGILLLTACGDNTPAPGGTTTTAATGTTAAATTTGAGATTQSATTAASAATTGTSSAATTQAGTAATTASAGTTTQASAATGATTTSANACLDADAAAAPAASAPKPTTTATALADLPDLSYPGGKALKPNDDTTKGILTNLNSLRFEQLFGKFQGDKVQFYSTSDSFDKADAAYRKRLEDAGWQLFKSDTDAPTKQSLLVYQKGGSKVVLSIETISDVANYPAEFKDSLKKDDTLVLIASGRAVSAAEPTPFAIPGSPVAEVKAGQHKYATIEMEKGGKIVIELCPNLAPKTVENFEKLATKNFYNGLTFHRVEKDPQPFVVQGGDPSGNGSGGPGYNIPDEFTTFKKHTRGTVAMAHSQAANSAGSQFYICLAPAAFLDGKYAIFGQVIEGMDIVDKIAVGDKMKSVTISVK